MDGLSKCILTCLNRIGSDRTISATFYILKGKKSSQTIQDIHLFKLTPYFCVFPDLLRSEYDNKLVELKKEGYVSFSENNILSITNKAREIICSELLPSLNGYTYGKSSQIFWKRLHLLTQTISNLMENKRFRPNIVDEDVQFFVKKYVLTIQYSKEQLNRFLFEECYKFLQSRRKTECEIFVRKLSGANKIGLTNKQIAEALSVDEWDIHLILQSILHNLLEKIDEYPLLKSICPPFEIEKIGDSTNKTKKLIELNKSIDEISVIRKLKRSTVEDHIIEIVMNETNFPIEKFVSVDKQKIIQEIYNQLSTKKLKVMKENLESDISYFEIRMVLARMDIYD